MYSIPLKLALIILFTAFISLTLFLLFRSRKPLNRMHLVSALCIIGVGITLYIRKFVHTDTIPAPSDEANYIDILTRYAAGEEQAVSGPGFVYIIDGLDAVFNAGPLRVVSVTAGIVSIFYLVILYLGYKRTTSKTAAAFLVCIFLCTTSYFLWPMIEGRPQQIGMLLTFAGMILFYKYLGDWRYLPFFAGILCVTFVYHILSFLVLSGGAMLLWWYLYVTRRTELKKAAAPSALVLTGLFGYFNGWFLYGGSTGFLQWMLRDSDVSFLGNYVIFIVLVGIAVAIGSVATFITRKRLLVEFLLRYGKRYSKPIFLVMGCLAVGAFLIQYYLIRDIYSAKYFSNPLYFGLMQVGNIFFGVCFIYGAYIYVNDDREDDVFLSSAFILMGMGALVLVASMFLPEGANNWLVRILNYWTLFAAPVAVAGLWRLERNSRGLMVILIPLLIVVSLLNISRDPLLFGYP